MTIFNIICISTIVLLLMFLLYYIHTSIVQTTERFTSLLRKEWDQVSNPQLGVMPSNMLSPMQLYGIDGQYTTLGNIPNWFNQQDLTTAVDGTTSNKDLALQMATYGQDSDYAKQDADYLSELSQKHAYYSQQQQREQQEYESQMSAEQRQKSYSDNDPQSRGGGTIPGGTAPSAIVSGWGNQFEKEINNIFTTYSSNKFIENLKENGFIADPDFIKMIQGRHFVNTQGYDGGGFWNECTKSKSCVDAVYKMSGLKNAPHGQPCEGDAGWCKYNTKQSVKKKNPVDTQKVAKKILHNKKVKIPKGKGKKSGKHKKSQQTKHSKSPTSHHTPISRNVTSVQPDDIKFAERTNILAKHWGAPGRSQLKLAERNPSELPAAFLGTSFDIPGSYGGSYGENWNYQGTGSGASYFNSMVSPSSTPMPMTTVNTESDLPSSAISLPSSMPSTPAPTPEPAPEPAPAPGPVPAPTSGPAPTSNRHRHRRHRWNW